MSNNDDINFDEWGNKPEKKMSVKVSDRVSDTSSPDETPKTGHNRTTHKVSDNVSDNKSEEIHLEDLMISQDEIWQKMVPKSRALKNWLTMNHPRSPDCKRGGALSEITLITNEIILEKLKQFKEKYSK